MLARLDVNCDAENSQRVIQFMLDTGLAQNAEWHPVAKCVIGDFVNYFDPSREQAKAMEQLHAFPGVSFLTLHSDGRNSFSDASFGREKLIF